MSLNPRQNPLFENMTESPTFDQTEIETPFTTRGKVPTNREIKKELRTKTAKEALGELYPDCAIFGVTKGQFSLIELLSAILDQTGPATVFISTWTAAKTDMAEAHDLLKSGKIKDIRFIVDATFQRRAPGLANALRTQFGPDSIRVTRNHAKFILITNDKWNLVLKTSMNLNQNPRLEDFDIQDDARLAGFLTDLMDEIFNKVKVSDIEKMAKFHQERFDSI